MMGGCRKISIEGEIHSSKNSRRILRNRKTGSPFVAKSKSSKLDEESFALQLSRQRETWEALTQNCTFPIIIIFSFRRATKRKFDYVNMAQGILDAMVKAEYIPDDSADYVVPFFTPYVIEKNNPGCDLMVISSTEAQQVVQRAAIAASQQFTDNGAHSAGPCVASGSANQSARSAQKF